MTDYIEQCAKRVKDSDDLSWSVAILTDLVNNTKADERQRCADISTAVFLNRGTCKQATDHGKGWNAACADINHRITTDGRCITQSPIPALIQALQAVKRDSFPDGKGFPRCAITPATLLMVTEALEELNTPKEL